MRFGMSVLGEAEKLRSISDGLESEVVAFSYADEGFVPRLYQGEGVSGLGMPGVRATFRDEATA